MRNPRTIDEGTSALHDRLVERARRSLLRRGAPRLQMTFIVTATGLAGLGASVGLRQLGLGHMGLRYGLAVGIAYGGFLALLWGWLSWNRRQLPPADGGRGSVLDLTDLPLPDAGGSSPPPPWAGAGGRFGGGGSSGDLPFAASELSSPTAGPSPSTPRSGTGFFGGLDLDLDELAAVVLAVLALASALVAAGWVVYEAPTMFADVLVDGAISAGLYRRLRRGHLDAWWMGAVRRTAIPAIAVLVFFVAAGLVIQHAWPQARTLGDVRLLLGAHAR